MLIIRVVYKSIGYYLVLQYIMSVGYLTGIQQVFDLCSNGTLYIGYLIKSYAKNQVNFRPQTDYQFFLHSVSLIVRFVYKRIGVY